MTNIANSKTKFVLGATTAFVGALTFGVGSASADTYTVKSGDTLNKIAQEHNTTVDEIAQQNNIDNINLIYVNETFNINVALPSTEGKATNSVQDETVSTTTNVASSTPVQNTSDAKSWIANKESGGSYTAQNPSGAYGKYQLMPSNLKYGTSPEAQEKAADEYVVSRYGSWDNAKLFWLANNWY